MVATVSFTRLQYFESKIYNVIHYIMALIEYFSVLRNQETKLTMDEYALT